MPPTSSTVTTPDGINWYCERQGSGPDLVLVPSGEGDCESFAKVAALLSSSFTVTTFDMPGMSRTAAPPSALGTVTAQLLAKQVAGLMEKLSIESASVYGCSSGGATVLALVANYPTRIRSAIVHEVPMGPSPQLSALKKLDDMSAMHACRDIFANFMNEDQAAWEAVGPEYHARLDKNYVTWVRHYMDNFEAVPIKEEVTRRPVSWTVGSLAPMGVWFQNVVVACNCGIPISLLPSKHFPQVSIPDKLAEHIRDSVAKMEKTG